MIIIKNNTVDFNKAFYDCDTVAATQTSMADIYNTAFVEKLFDEMSESYEKVNYITSFGFSKRWRSQFVEKAAIKSEMTVCDLMCGMGECWSAVAKRLNDNGRLLALDLSTGMLKGAQKRRNKFPNLNITVDKQNALASALEDESVDCIVSAFGIKTFSDEQKKVLAAEMNRILKPQGTVSLIEVSVPRMFLLKPLYMFYLKRIIPLIGFVFLGNPDNYRMLGVYTEKFGDCRNTCDILKQQGFRVAYQNYFFGCATGLTATKLDASANRSFL